MNLFLLTADPGADDTAGPLALLAAALPAAGFGVAVGVLGPPGAVAAAPRLAGLAAAGVRVLALPVRGPLDLSGMRRLRAAVRAAGAAVLHAVGPAAARAARLCLLDTEYGNAPRLVVSGAADADRGVGGWLTGRQVRRADRVIATGWAEAERYRAAGVAGDRLTRIAPAAEALPAPPDRPEFLRDVGAPEGARLIFAGGRLDAAHGWKDAVTAFDMLRYVSPALNLVLTGGGPDREAAADLGRALAFDDFRIRFAGDRPDLAAAAQLAEQVWVLCARGGGSLALRAMAAGRPVVAFRTPEVEEVVEDGVTGLLVPPGDRAGLATKAQELLTDRDLTARLGESARARAAERFSVGRFVEQHARVYRELAR